jgi:hypothetical protein
VFELGAGSGWNRRHGYLDVHGLHFADRRSPFPDRCELKRFIL